MSEPKKNHLTIDGGQVKEDERTATYQPIPDSDSEYLSPKPNLAKSKEKLSSDGAEEKLLQKEHEAKITTKVDMADAKYVVGDHRNGDAKIELDANKKPFTGLSKEELLRYAEDPFWVRLRWFMFLAFWAMWLCMLGAAVGIIVRAPACSTASKTWFEKGPLVDMSSVESFKEIEANLPLLQSAKVRGIFYSAPSYEVLDDETTLQRFKRFADSAKEYGVKVIVDLTANYVPVTHKWFQSSENGTAEFASYFVWAKENGSDATGKPNPPNVWSVGSTSAWSWSDARKAFYLHQFGEDTADLNFTNPQVVRRFDDVIKLWMGAGAAGVRLQKSSQLFVMKSVEDWVSVNGSSVYTAEPSKVEALVSGWAEVVRRDAGEGEPAFAEWRAPLQAEEGQGLQMRLLLPGPLQLTSTPENAELAVFAMLLPAAPVLSLAQLPRSSNDTAAVQSFSNLVSLRDDASIEHGSYRVANVPASVNMTMLACVRWKSGHTGYAAVYNGGSEEGRADLRSLPSVPDTLSVHYATQQTRLGTNYTLNSPVAADAVLVPARSALVLSYVPKTSADM